MSLYTESDLTDTTTTTILAKFQCHLSTVVMSITATGGKRSLPSQLSVFLCVLFLPRETKRTQRHRSVVDIDRSVPIHAVTLVTCRSANFRSSGSDEHVVLANVLNGVSLDG